MFDYLCWSETFAMRRRAMGRRYGAHFVQTVGAWIRNEGIPLGILLLIATGTALFSARGLIACSFLVLILIVIGPIPELLPRDVKVSREFGLILDRIGSHRQFASSQLRLSACHKVADGLYCLEFALEGERNALIVAAPESVVDEVRRRCWLWGSTAGLAEMLQRIDLYIERLSKPLDAAEAGYGWTPALASRWRAYLADLRGRIGSGKRVEVTAVNGSERIRHDRLDSRSVLAKDAAALCDDLRCVLRRLNATRPGVVKEYGKV